MSDKYNEIGAAIGEASQAFWKKFWDELAEGQNKSLDKVYTKQEIADFMGQVGGFSYQLELVRNDRPSAGSKCFADTSRLSPFIYEEVAKNGNEKISGEISIGGTIRF